MSYTFLLTGNTSVLTASYFPEILLTAPTEVGLLNFTTFYSVNNIKRCEIVFDERFIIVLESGIYSLSDLKTIINSQLRSDRISIEADTVTHRVHLSCTTNFKLEPQLSKLLGFSETNFLKNKIYKSDLIVNILPINLIQVELNIARGGFLNEKEGKSIYAFIPSDVPHGFRINQTPEPVIYYPVITNTISNISLKITDQEGELIDFQGEQITVRLHFRPIAS